MYISENIKYLRKRNGLTQEELGSELGFVKSTVSIWEKGGATPKLEEIVKIAKFFNVTLDELIVQCMIPERPMYLKNIEYLRKREGLTQDYMAELLGLKTGSAYCKKELAESFVTPDELFVLANFFGVTMDALYKQDLEKEEKKQSD